MRYKYRVTTNKMQVPRIDLGAINSGGGDGSVSSGLDGMDTAPTGIKAPIHVETGSNHTESDDGYAGSRDDDVRVRMCTTCISIACGLLACACPLNARTPGHERRAAAGSIGRDKHAR